MSAVMSGAAALACALLAAAPAAGQAASVPSGYIAMNFDGPAIQATRNPGSQLKLIRESGAQRVRVVLSWKLAQPYASWKDVPKDQKANYVTGPGGVPTNFTGTDLLVGGVAQQHLSLTPVVLY